MAGHGYDKTTKIMMNDFVKEVQLTAGQEVSSSQILGWFRENYPNVKDGTVRGHLIAMSTNAKSRIHHNNVRPGSGHDLFYQIDSKTFRLYEAKKDPSPIYKQGYVENLAPDDETDVEEHAEFGFEKDLQNFLVKNLELIEPGLKLYENEGITGIEYPVGNRFADILATDSNNDLTVIELKVSKGYDRVIGQILRYMAWIEINLADESQKVRGMIIARQISEDLKLACSKIPDVELMEYELSVKIKKLYNNNNLNSTMKPTLNNTGS